MKPLYVVAAILLASQAVYGQPNSFAEFQQLPEEQRTTLAHNLSNPMNDQYRRWSWRLHLGEQAWQERQQRRLIYQYDHDAIESLFDYYMHLRQVFAEQQIMGTQPAGPTPTNSVQADQLNKEFNAAREQFEEADHVLSTLAPTPQARALNKKADALVGTWINAHPLGTKVALSVAAMNAVTQSNQAVLTEMAKLPKLSADEIQKAVDALRPDGPSKGEIF